MSTPAAATKAPTGATARPHLLGERIDLSWSNPPASAFAGGPAQIGVTIVRRERTFPLRPDDGSVVYAGTGPVIERFSDTGLTPLTRYYYTIFAFDGAEHHAGPGSVTHALATAEHGLAERLYRLLPAVHQREDPPLRPDELRELSPQIIDALRALPPNLRSAGQLRRFLAAAGSTLGLMRSTAEGLRQLHDVDRVPPEYLPLLAAFLDWRTDSTLPVFSQRNEIRAAPWLYRSVGTVPNLRAIVTRYTGWQTRVAEYAQHIARSNHPAQGNVFALRETAAGWQAADDAAAVLGFGPGNTEATGMTATPATLVSTLAGPFRLRPGMELTITADARVPVTARFRPGDAATLSAASAAEVAVVLSQQVPEVVATATAAGRLQLRSQTSGAASTVRIEPADTSLVTLDGAPRGRLALAITGPAEFRLFYAVADPLNPAEERAASRIAAGIPFARPPVLGGTAGPAGPQVPLAESPWLPTRPVTRLRYKAFRQGSFGDSFDVFADSAVPTGEPATATLPPAGPGGSPRILLTWLDQPDTADARLRYTIGLPGTPRPAELLGERSSPLPVPHNALLVVRRETGPPRGVFFARTDFADPAAPTVAEVANVINTRLAGFVTASVLPGQRLRLESVAVGGDARLEIDLQLSSAAAALGFGATNHAASGEWGDAVTWQAAQDVEPVPPGRLADLAAVADGDGALLTYARHDGAAWQVRAVRFDGASWGTDETLSSGVLSSREPAVGREGTGRIWAVWARQGAVASGRWSLRRRTRDPGTGVWDAETAVTQVPAEGRDGDREPALAIVTGSPPQVYFRSDRAGGHDLWQQPVGGTATAVTAGAPGDSWPTPVDVAGRRWLLYRSDRPVAHASAGSGPATDTGTLRRYAGSTTIRPSDVDRLRRLHAWDDLVAYTPSRPEGDSSAAPLLDDELYTRGTVGLYLTQTVSGLLDEEMAERLRSVLGRFLPQNTRAVVWLAPSADIEYVYPPGADLGESYLDKHPDIDQLGPVDERIAVSLPGWTVLLSARPSVPPAPPPPDPASGGVSADRANLTSLRFRSYAPPPQ